MKSIKEKIKFIREFIEEIYYVEPDTTKQYLVLGTLDQLLVSLNFKNVDFDPPKEDEIVLVKTKDKRYDVAQYCKIFDKFVFVANAITIDNVIGWRRIFDNN